MLVTPEDNPLSGDNQSPRPEEHHDSPADSSQPTEPSTPPEAAAASPFSEHIQSSPPPSTPLAEPPATHTPRTNMPPAPKSKSKMGSMLLMVLGLIVVVALIIGAFQLGKHHEKIIVRAPAPQPINLPPQATVLQACVPGRGKQYILPKDIPNGPIYDVENSKVIAVEYNLSIDQLFTNSDTFSNAILSITKNYPVDHFSIVPVETGTSTSAAAQATPTDIHLIMFVVSKAEADAITCGSSTGSST